MNINMCMIECFFQQEANGCTQIPDEQRDITFAL